MSEDKIAELHAYEVAWGRYEALFGASPARTRPGQIDDGLSCGPVRADGGKGQKVARCPGCRVALWSTYAGAGEAIRFLRVGTLDEPDRLRPDIHIFTASKQPWVLLPPGVPAVEEFYDRNLYWPPESLARRRALQG